MFLNLQGKNTVFKILPRISQSGDFTITGTKILWKSDCDYGLWIIDYGNYSTLTTEFETWLNLLSGN